MAKNNKEKIVEGDGAVKPTCPVVSPIGGQAVLEGVMMRGTKSMALCVRAESGELLLDTARLKNTKKGIARVPVIRGVVNFVSSMVLGVKTLTKSAEVFGTEEETLSKGAVFFAVFLGLAFSVGLFIFLPSLVTSGVCALFGIAASNVLASSLIEGAFRLIIFISYLLLTSLLKDIRRTYMYHGAEHKTINCYEHGLELTVENVAKSSKVHNRCGTTFLFLVVFVSILMFALANWLVVLIGWPSSWWVKLLVRLVLLPLVAGISYEILRGFARLPDNLFTKIIRAPGLSLQAITTKEPTPQMIEVAIKAFTAVQKMDADEEVADVNFDELSFAQAKQTVSETLKAVSAENAETDWIFCDVLGVERSALKALTTVRRVDFNKAVVYAKKRVSTKKPLAYILGKTYFYGDVIKVAESVLIPRPETELLAEQAVLAVLEKKGSRVLDMCTGSGCIAYAVAKYGEAEVTAADISPQALYIAKQNCKDLNVKCVESDLFFNIAGTFDVIVSNPPYIPTRDLATLQEEVKKEPAAALNGGADGLDFYRRLANESPEFLNDGGRLMLEVGIGQSQAVAELLGHYFTDIQVLNDYDKIPRIILAAKKHGDAS